MKRLGILVGASLAMALASAAAADPVASRQAIMSSVGAAAAVTGGIMKGDLAYVPAVGKSAISTMHAAAMTYGSFFPEGSEGGDSSKAAPAIWSDRAGFEAEIAKFVAATSAADAAAGRNGPADAAAFTELMRPVMANCSGCHEKYRLQ